MFTFFDKGARFSSKSISKKTFRNKAQDIVTDLSGQSVMQLIKVLISNQGAATTKDYINTVIKQAANRLIIMTTPSIRLIGEDYNYIYPGHNASFITDEKGVIGSTMSKRATNQVLRTMTPVPDTRFKDRGCAVRLYESIFTSVEYEIDVWAKKASFCKNYPIYLHVIPFSNELNMDKADYEDNVEAIKAHSMAYSLRSYINPYTHQYVAAKNCNHAVEQALFGMNHETVQDLFCQEAVMCMMAKLIQNTDAYRVVAEEFGLYEGIENSTIDLDKSESISVVL